MVKNYLLIALRNLLKNKTFSFINLIGLAFGLCCTLLIALWVFDEYSIDQYHQNKDQIYQVISEMKSSDGSQFWTSSPGPLAPYLKGKVTGLEKIARMSRHRQQLFIKGDLKIEEYGVSADSEILEIFDLPLVQGNIKTALLTPNNIIISQELALKLFPDGNALNQLITVDDWGSKHDFTITGILAPFPKQRTFSFQFIIPFERYLINRPWNNSWKNYNDITYMLFAEGTNMEQAEVNIQPVVQENFKESTTDLYLYPFKDLYLRSDFSKGLDAEGRIVYVRIFVIIAILILVIACINFMNLSTAKAAKRAKEVGVRKATGASKTMLVVQFLCESIILALISGAMAVTLADVLIVFFNQLTNKNLSIPYESTSFIVSMVGLCTFTGILAGIYPAFYLSSFNPAKVLKSSISTGKSLTGFRRVLVVFQFTLSIVFVVSTLVVYKQLNFILNKDVGMAKEKIFYHELNGVMGQRDAYRNDIMKIPGIKSMSHTNFDPLQIYNSTTSIKWKGKPEGLDTYFHVIQTDSFFLSTFSLPLLEGTNFTGKIDTSLVEVLINETAAKTMELEHPVGEKIKVWNGDAIVVGLVPDFHHQALDKKIDPVIIYYNTQQAWRSNIAVTGNMKEIIAEVEKVYYKYESMYPFRYGFQDQDFEKTYAHIKQMGKLSNVFAATAIFISSLGLFGLASYMTEQRKKETGIRKVMGAGVLELVLLFTKKFMGLIVVSFVIGAPIAWFIVSEWLSGFVFRTELNAWPFLIGGLGLTLIALTTVTYHTVKVALSNPIQSLKYE